MERVAHKNGEGYPKLIQHCVTRGSTSWKMLSAEIDIRLGATNKGLLGGGGQKILLGTPKFSNEYIHSLNLQ